MDTRLRRDVVWNLVPVALLGGVGLGINFLIAAWWGAAALGVFNLVTIAFFVFAVIGAWGIQFSVLRGIAAHPDEIPAVVVGALIPTVGLATLVTVAWLVLRQPTADLQGSDAVAEGMLWATPGLFCFAVNKVLFGIVNGHRRMRAFAVYTSMRYLLLGTGLVLAKLLELDGDQLPVIWSFTECTLILVMIGELVMTVKLRACAGWTRWMREHVSYGARGVGATLAQEINSKLDVWMLGAAGISKELVGIYSLAAALNEGAAQLAFVVQANLNPVIARSLAAGDTAAVEALVRRTRKWFVPAMVAAAAFGAIAFPVVVPRLVGDSTFDAGTVPFAILMAGLALASPWLPFTQMLMMASRPGSYTLFIALVTSVNLVANLALIPPLGMHGAALSISIAALAMAAFLSWLSRARAGVRL